MIKLTTLDGHPIWIMKAWVQAVYDDPLLLSAYAPGTKTVVVLSGESFAVRETLDEVVVALQ